MEVKNDTVTVFFDRADMWINCKEKFASDLFEVAGEDRVFHPAKAWIERSKVKVKSEAVKSPVAVRYAFKIMPRATFIVRICRFPHSVRTIGDIINRNMLIHAS